MIARIWAPQPFFAARFLPRVRKYFVASLATVFLAAPALLCQPATDTLARNAATRATEDLIEATFTLNKDSVFTSYGDMPPLMAKGERVTYKLPRGKYTFKFRRSGFADQTTAVDLTQPKEIAITLLAGRSEGNLPLLLPGFVSITSEPPGAEVMINGQTFGATPLEEELLPGAHHLELRKTLYHPERSTLLVEEVKTLTLAIMLKPRFGYLTVTSPGLGGTLFLDGKKTGALPIRERFIESGAHTVRVVMPGSDDYTEEIEVSDGEEKIVTALFTPAAVMPEGASPRAPGADTASDPVVLEESFGEITVHAPESDIFLNGELKGRNEYRASVPPGSYTIRATREGPYHPEEKEVVLSAGDEQAITLEPRGRYGTLSVQVEPPAAGDAEIYLGEELQGNAPLTVPLLMGAYRVRALKPGFVEQVESVVIDETETSRLNFTLFTNEESRRAAIAKWGKVKWVSGAGALLAGGAAVYFKAQSNKYYDKYTAARTTPDAVAFRQKTRSNDRLFTVALGAASGLAVTAIVSWIVQGAF